MRERFTASHWRQASGLGRGLQGLWKGTMGTGGAEEANWWPCCLRPCPCPLTEILCVLLLGCMTLWDGQVGSRAQVIPVMVSHEPARPAGLRANAVHAIPLFQHGRLPLRQASQPTISTRSWARVASHPISSLLGRLARRRTGRDGFSQLMLQQMDAQR